MIHLLLLLLTTLHVPDIYTFPQLPRAGRVLVVDGEPRDSSPPGHAGFRLPLAAQDAVVVEVDGGQEDPTGGSEIPRDTSGEGRAGFRLPLPELEDDFVVIESAGGEE